MKKLYKILGLLILILNFNQFTNAKPLPPGSGEGDVPANILILLDSSASMTARIGGGFPALTSAATDWNGNRVFTNASKQDGGLYMVNSTGERINFSGTKDNGDTYQRSVWWANNDTDRTCDNNINHRGKGTNYLVTENKMLHEVRYVTGVTVGGTDISNENLLFIGQYQPKNSRSSIIAVDDQYRCRLAMNINGVNANSHKPLGFDISNNADGDIIVAAYGREGKNAYQQTCNLNDGKCGKVTDRGKGRTTQYGRLYDGARFRLNSDSTVMYVSDENHVYGYQTRIVNGVPVIQSSSSEFRKCSGSAGATGTQVGDIQNFDISSSDDDVMYVAGRNNRVQRVEWTSNKVCTATVTAGTANPDSNRNETAGNLDAADIRITDSVNALNIVGGRIIFTHNGHVDELTENLFTSARKDDAWQIAYGGTVQSRMDGAKSAIIAVLSDSSLTSGANFGFGHWNAGEKGYTRNKNPGGGAYCHKNSTSCEYYEGWSGVHPAGNSRVCSENSCLNVGISPEGANRAIQVVKNIGTSFGTDSEAFSQIAFDYFTGPNSPHDPNSDCQLNYVIVIGDGMMTGTGTASNRSQGRTADRLTTLRTDLGIKSLMVAYGPGIKDAGMEQFDQLAVVGSCDAAGGQDCEATIVAKTPLELQTTLAQKIRQILAERLSFTAPSITATIQQGGSLYQAQFAYEQHGEWQGTILRKTLNSDGTVDHGENSPGNWDAAKRVKLQSAGGTADPGNTDGRNIWTAIGNSDANYIGNWDNVNETNAPLLEPEMERLGYQINNYYTSSSTCTGNDTTTEERNGLLRFLAGQDFFDYNGDCDITQLRDHVLGDIYHSQLIEIGAPDGNLKFTDNNQEAYFRATNNYQSFKNSYASRRDVLYAGSNSGLLHAFSAQTGDEEWAFLPPLLIGKLPTIINSSLDGRVNGSNGGSNAIFGVDGSPVVHDVFMKGLTPEGNIEGAKSWHSILFVPFGRGGAGFSVLDVTNPIVRDGAGPLHMFTVYNDYINNIVYIADHEGNISEEEYSSGSANISSSIEAKKATSNFDGLVAADGGADSTTFTNRDANAACQSNAEVSGNFATNGTTSCYIGRSLTFNDVILNTPNNQAIDPNMLNVTEMVGGEFLPVTFSDARMLNGELVITFNEDKIFNIGQSSNEERITNNIFVQTSCTAERGIDPTFDYSKLGETWSTPRIARLPSDIEGDSADPANDKYVAIMGGGMANNNLCAGSALFLIELDNIDEPGRIYGAEANGGPITIIDTSPEGVALGNDVIATPNGSDINNAIPTSPLVITPDTAFGIPWRGAMVYINDREGKITKINLTDSTVNDARLFDQTTLFRLNASSTNKRYTFFSMDAGVGVTTRDFWLFGGTGDFNQLGDKGQFMDNILYGVRDFDFPNFKHLNDVVVPSYNDESFTLIAHQGADKARSIEDAAVCSDVTADTDGRSCPNNSKSAWVIHLDEQDDNNSHRKVSAPPTLFKGQVYFPIYEPAPGSNRCNIGNAYICVADDECGTNNSHNLVKGSEANGKNCTFVREGVLSELVIFGDKLFANVAGPSDNENTLYSILALAGEVLSNRGGWRDVGF